MKNTYAKTWIKDFWGIFCHELRQIFSDSGVLLIFLGSLIFLKTRMILTRYPLPIWRNRKKKLPIRLLLPEP